MPRLPNYTSVWRVLAFCAAVTALAASEHHGLVKSGGLPVPGATISATKDGKTVTTTTDANGAYSFANLEDGNWNVQVSMLGFAKAFKEIGIAPQAPSPEWDLKLMTMADFKASIAPPAPAPAPAETPKPAAPATTAAAPSAPPAAASTPAGAASQAGQPAARPSLQQAVQQQRGNQNQRGNQTQGGRGNAQGRGGQTGFQRAEVNQSGDLAAAGQEGAITQEMAADLSQSASDSLLVNGSISRGLDMPQQPDWFGGRGGMDGMGPGMGMGDGLGGFNGMNGLNGQDGAGGQDGQGGGRGGRGGPGGPGGPGGRGGPAGAFAGGPGGRGGPGGPGGGFGGPGGGFGGRGGGPGGRGGGRDGGGRGGQGRAGVAAFGNARRNPRMRYNGNLGFTFDNSVWDAQTYSVTGAQVAKPSYGNGRGSATFGGPLKIPHLLSGNRGTFILSYSLNRSRTGTTQTTTMPTALERAGDFSQSFAQGPVTIFDPLTGNPFAGNVIPRDRISPVALGLLKFYPNPNFSSISRNYSAPITRVNNSNNVSVRLNQTLNTKNRLNGSIGYQGGSSISPNIFGFTDTGNSRGMNFNAGYTHNFTTRVINSLNYQFSRNRNLASPFFSLRENVEQELGISGASPNPINWGPPTLQFTNFSGLSDGSASLSRNQTSAVSESVIWVRKLHNFNFGASYRRQQINPLADSNARGTLNFTGNATAQIVNGLPVQGTGFDFADFLLGRPNTSAINFGNADKYFRTSAYSAYLNDDWRMSTKFSLNGGIRWDYQTPVTELFNRLVNLDIAPGFTAIAPVTPGSVGPLTGIHYPKSLVNGQPNHLSPRIGFAWRPFPKHSTRVNGGFGLYYNTGAYQQIANYMAAQPPFSQNYSLGTSPSNPLSISTFQVGQNLLTNTRAIDPFYSIGYAQIFQLSVQNDLGRALVGSVTLNHTKGTHLDQQFLPNSLPPGSKATPTGPAGYIYTQANGNSTFNSAQFNLNRRTRSGIGANLSYMWSKALDNGGIGTLIAQDWQNLSAERGLSAFDRRHTLNANWQYSSGSGTRGGALLNGWKGVLAKGWNFSNTFSVQTGSPLTANSGGIKSTVVGTGVSGPVRASATGVSLFPATPGYGFNLAAFTAPAAGTWGTAGRNIIPGPTIFSLNASLGRNFRLAERKSLALRFDVTNALNHVTITNWGTTLASSTFGLPTTASGMRRMNATLRFTF